MSSLSRRNFLKYSALAGGALLLPTALYGRAQASSDDSPFVQPFTLPFRRPPVLQPVRSDATTDYYHINIQPTQVEIIPGLMTPAWSYNGLVPGPTIMQRQGRQSVIRFVNGLSNVPFEGKLIDVPTSVHLHGMASLPQYDGFANDLTHPGYYKDYYYPNNRAATLWYHDHAVHRTARNVYMGLAGLYLVQDDVELNLPLPKGEYDVPLCLQDKLFNADGSFNYDNQGHKGVNGDVILVNGVPFPRMEVANRRYRFRLLNASAGRSYRLSLSTGEPLIMIGTDAGLMEKPVPVQNFRVSMAERYEFIIDFSKYRVGTQIILRNTNPRNNDEFDSTGVVMRFDVVREEPDTSSIPSFLRPFQVLSASSAKRTRDWRFERENGQWRINGKGWDPTRVDANPGLGDVEIWRLYNKSGGWFHPVHVHLVDLQILSRNGKPPLPYERGWKDVFYVGENEDLRVIARFGPHIGKYMTHCHNVDHEDFDMMVLWEVGQGGPDPMSAPPQPLPAPPL